MLPENDCQCKCRDNGVWNIEKLECQKAVKCPKTKCGPGTTRTEFDCECKHDEAACKKEEPNMKWAKIDGKGKCIPTLPCDIRIRCPHWMTLGDCKCDDITDKRKCLSIDGNGWDATNNKCQQEQKIVCVTSPCPQPLAAIPDTFAQKENKCIALSCNDGERRSIEDCECKSEKEICEK